MKRRIVENLSQKRTEGTDDTPSYLTKVKYPNIIRIKKYWGLVMSDMEQKINERFTELSYRTKSRLENFFHHLHSWEEVM